ncbi:MAG TPA: hypothetical protein VF894_05070 [Anaeromyxobacter sp.]
MGNVARVRPDRAIEALWPDEDPASSATDLAGAVRRRARLEVRLRGPGAARPEEVRALDPLVVVDADG